MSYKPEVLVNGEWGQNATCFATEEEAKAVAHDVYSRWLLCTDYRAVESSDPVNYAWRNGQLEPASDSL